ncbi:MAG TPA: hypothetical protein VME45_14730 [Stellaceae bacterium]|nr:hypothetical protein [Stellaceae bacterium]
MRVLKIVAAIIASQCALGFAVGFTCPWLGFYLLHIGNPQTLFAWSAATAAPFALAIDATAFTAIGVYAWRRRVARFARSDPGSSRAA